MDGNGTYYFADGGKYIGYSAKNKFNGHGIRTWPNGDRYEGNFKDDKKDGNGTYYYADGGKYIGYYVKDKFNGHGIRTWPSGDRYEGNWIDDVQA
jgi:hypothetical protein